MIHGFGLSLSTGASGAADCLRSEKALLAFIRRLRALPRPKGCISLDEIFPVVKSKSVYVRSPPST